MAKLTRDGIHQILHSAFEVRWCAFRLAKTVDDELNLEADTATLDEAANIEVNVSIRSPQELLGPCGAETSFACHTEEAASANTGSEKCRPTT